MCIYVNGELLCQNNSSVYTTKQKKKDYLTECTLVKIENYRWCSKYIRGTVIECEFGHVIIRGYATV